MARRGIENARALGAGLRLLVREPGAALAWFAVSVVQQLVYLAVMVATRTLGGASAVWGALAYLPFEAVLIAAVFRAALGGPGRRTAFLRLGPVEARMGGLLLAGGLVALAIAVPASIAAGYVVFLLRQPALGAGVLPVGALAAAMALLRFAPAPAILVEEGRVDLKAAWAATRGQVLRLAILVLLIAVGGRLAASLAELLPRAPTPFSVADVLAPVRLPGLLARALIDTVSLALTARVVVQVWRDRRQTSR